MLKSVAIVLFTLCLICKGDNSVRSFNKMTFSDNIPSSEGKTWVIMFYAPWCGRCEKLLPVWDEVADHYTNDNSLQFGKVDCTVHHALCGRQLVGKYPTFIYYKDEYKVKYDSRERTFDDFIQWIDSDPQPVEIEEEIKESIPIVSKVVEVTDDTADVLQKGVWLVSFVASWCQHSESLIPILDEVSSLSEEYQVAKIDYTTELGLVEKYSITHTPTSFILYDNERINLKAGRSVPSFKGQIDKVIKDKNPEIVEFIDDEPICRIVSNVITLTEENFDEKTRGKDFFILFYAPWCNFCTELQPIWELLADATEDQYNIAKIDAIEELPVRVRFRVGGYPTMILWTAQEERIRYYGERNVQAMKDFLFEELGY